MSSTTSYAVSLDEGFNGRVNFFMKKAAVAVYAESLSTAGHTERVAYAATVLNGTASVADYTLAVLTNATIDAAGLSALDSDLEFTVNSMFNAFAGYESGPA